MRLLYLSLLCLFTLGVNAQYYPHHHFTEEDGLVDNSIKDLLIDKEGYLWIATNNGISKYDGNTFKNIYKSDGLLNNRVWALACDDNNIWVGCYQGGLIKIVNDRVVAKFTINNERLNNEIRKLHYSAQFETLFVGTDDGLFVFKDSVFTQIQSPKGNDTGRDVLSIVEKGRKVFYTIHGSGLKASGIYELNLELSNISQSEVKRLRDGNHFGAVILGDSLFTNTNYQIEKWLWNGTKSDTIKLKTESNFLIWDMCTNHKDKIWFAGWGGDQRTAKVKEYNTKASSVKQVPFEVSGESFASNLYDAHNGIMWVAGNGLYALKENPFKYYKLDEFNDLIVIDDKLATISPENLVYYKDGKITKTLSANHINNRLERLIRQNANSFDSNDVSWWHLHKNRYPLKLIRFIDTNEKQWLLTNKGCISIPNLNEFLPFGSGSFAFTKSGSSAWVEDYKPIRYYRNDKIFRTEFSLSGLAAEIKNVVKIVQKGDTLLFPSHFHGMFALVDEKGYKLNSSKGFDDIITDLTISPDQDMWCTSQDGNLFQVGLRDSLYVISKYNKEHGLRGTKYNWLKFHNDHLYIGTNKGLNVIPIIDLKEGNFTNSLFFNKHNGYSFINSKKPQVDSDGRLFVHTSDKVIYIDIDKASSTKLGEIIIESHVNNEPTRIDGASLSYDQNKIEINFKTITYPTAKNIRYAYQINKTGWQEGDNIKLESLVSRSYEIDIRATDIATNESIIKTINFTINQVFWRSEWFIITTLMLFIATIYSISLLRIRKIRKEAEEKERLNNRLNEISIRSLQGQLNPHFIFNALNSIQYFILSKNVKDALMYLGSLSGVIRKNLHNLGQEMILLEDEVRFIQEYLDLEKLRFKDKLDYNISVRTKSTKLKVPPMLIQPVIENAIKHGIMNSNRNGEIWIDIAESHVLNIIITDNGIGTSAARQLANANVHTSNGKALKITKERIDLLNKKFRTDHFTFRIEEIFGEEKVEGTSVNFTLMLFN